MAPLTFIIFNKSDNSLDILYLKLIQSNLFTKLKLLVLHVLTHFQELRSFLILQNNTIDSNKQIQIVKYKIHSQIFLNKIML